MSVSPLASWTFAASLSICCAIHAPVLGAEDSRQLLNSLSAKVYLWGNTHTQPVSGLTMDRSRNELHPSPDPQSRQMASIGATGFTLALLPEWVRAGHLTEDTARNQAERTLAFVRDHVEHHKGLMYHFVDWQLGTRWGQSECSSLDTALLLSGACVSAQAFGGETADLTVELLDRVEWPAFVMEQANVNLLSLGWTPEKGLLGPIDVRSSESALAYYLAIGSTQSIDPVVWYDTTVRYGEVGGHRILNPEHPLFTSQYGILFHGFLRDVTDDGVDLWNMGRESALANRAFCRTQTDDYATYSRKNGHFFGISAGDLPHGRYGALGPVKHDAQGTVFPLTALGSVCWIENELLEDLQSWQSSPYWDQVNRAYGLSTFNLDFGPEPWFAPDCIAIDLLAFGVAWANARSDGIVWRHFSAHPVAQRAQSRLRLKPRL